MRGFRPTAELDLDEEVEGYRPRPKRPAPGKVTRTMGMEGRVIARRSTGDADGDLDVSEVAGVVDRTAGTGDALPDSLRGSFEESLGVRLADVRVHTDAAAAGAARAIAARAFTVGQDIYFADGQYDPTSEAGKHLIAHEVAHTAQQRGSAGQVATKLEVSKPGDAIEAEADAAADAMVAGHKAQVSAAGIGASRTPDPAATPAGPATGGQDAQAQGKNDLPPLTVTVNIKPVAGKMEFDAADYLELYKQVAARAAANACAGKCTCGVDQDYSQLDKNLVTINVTLETAVPTWKQRASAKPEHQAKFDAWAASVKVHEDAHAKKYTDAYNTLKTLMKNCADQAACEEVFKKVDTQVEADQVTFDNNKANQPAPLDIPGGVEKVPSAGVARKAAGDDPVDTSGVSGLVERTRGRGDALPDPLRTSFEQSLGVGLGGVRVHTGGDAADVARAISARAFAVGQDIYFAAGQYDPQSEGGKHLLAHEVAHTAQQAAGGASHVHTKLEVSSAGDAIEREADAAADAMVAGHAATVSAAPVSAARTPDGAQPAVVSDSGQDAQPQGDGAPTKVTVKVTVTPKTSQAMEFDAADYNALYQQVSARAQTNKCAGFCECGTAQCNYVIWESADGSKKLAKEMKIEVDITTSSPTWKQIASQPKADQDKFNAWAASVAAHEKLHFDTYKKGFEGMKTAITGPTEADCDSQYDTARKAIDPLQDAIDKNQQPAPLAAPGGMIKVPSSGVPPTP